MVNNKKKNFSSGEIAANPGKKIKACFIKGVFILAVCHAVPALSEADKAPKIQFDLPSSDLASALNSFAEKTGMELSYPASLVAGAKSKPLKGNYGVKDGLNELLRGSGLTYRATGDNSVTLEKVAAAEPQAGTTTLKTMTVIGETESLSLTSPSIAESKRRLNRVPGATTVIEGERIEEGAPLTVNDALANTAGVYVGDSGAGATSGSRISIRGSDINSDISPIRGLKFLRDGLPFSNANGATDTESLNFYAIDHIDVYRGASALEYGSSSLGGAINFITPTGYTADRLKVGMTLGTNGYVRPSVSAGGVLGKGFDAFGSFSYIDTNTTRVNNEQEQFLGYGNIGYRWNENHETRLSVDIQNHNYLTTDPLTKQQINDNPHQNPTTSTRPTGFPAYRVDLRHSIKLADGDRFDIGAYYFDKEFSFSYPFVFARDSWQDAGFSWRHEINGKLFGLKNKVVWGGLNQWMWIKDSDYNAAVNQNGSYYRGTLRARERDHWTNVEGFLEDQLSLTDAFTLVVGGQVNYRGVDYERTAGYVASAARPSNQADQDFFNFNPKLGFTWQATEEAQLYGNLSHSAEPPPLANLADAFLQPTRTSQTASTVEIGTRGQADWLKWDLAFYHAWLNDEILTIPTSPITFTFANAGKTQHTGIELALESIVPLNIIASGDQIRLSGNYTWSRFQFDNDQFLGDNRLPGIPEHNARFEALYQHPSGFYIGPNVQAVSSNWVDFSNTLAANPYALLGARVGWDDKKHWKVFVDGRNLTNEYYASSMWVTGDARGQDTAQFFPGATRGVFGGFEYRY